MLRSRRATAELPAEDRVQRTVPYRPERAAAPRLRRWTNRETALFSLVAIYLGVSAIAYTDVPRPSSTEGLSELEREGLGIWREHNCQACHQLHGFGGLLGPDLTNRVTADTPDEDLQDVLKRGVGAMPAFDFDREERKAVLAYLRAVDRSGQSQPPPLAVREPVVEIEHWRLLLEAWERDQGEPPSGDVRLGVEHWTRFSCGSCHVPFAPGKNRAPDLTRASLDRSMEYVRRTVVRGRRIMPSHRFVTDEEIAAIRAFLVWAAAHRPELTEVDRRLVDRARFSFTGVPWFEYR